CSLPCSLSDASLACAAPRGPGLRRPTHDGGLPAPGRSGACGLLPSHPTRRAMLSPLLPASLSKLQSLGVPAAQSGSVVVAVARLQSDGVAGWVVTLAAGTVGGSCCPVARTTVAARTRALARQSAVALAAQYARALAGGQLPPPLPPAPASGLAAEPVAVYQ